MDTYDLIMALFFAAVIIFTVVLTVKRMRSSRYHEAYGDVDELNLEEFGTPAKSLYTSSKILTLHNEINITDDNEYQVYQAKSKIISFRDYTEVKTFDGRLVAKITRKILSFHAVHYIEMTDGRHFTISRELWHIAKQIINLEELGWTINGHILHMNYYIKDQDENLVAVVGEKAISLHDKFSIDIYQPEYEEEVVAIFVTLLHMIQDTKNSSSSTSSASSAASSN